MISRRQAFLWRVWGITGRPWWLHSKRGRAWRRALTWAIISLSMSGCAGIQQCDDMPSDECRQYKTDLHRAAAQAAGTPASYYYGAAKEPE